MRKCEGDLFIALLKEFSEKPRIFQNPPSPHPLHYTKMMTKIMIESFSDNDLRVKLKELDDPEDVREWWA